MTAPPLAVEQPDGSRAYVHPVTGETVPSVTTILKMIGKPKLTGWAARMAAEYAVAHWDELSALKPYQRIVPIKEAHEGVSGAARDTGTAVHEIIENWMKGNPSQAGKQTDSFATQLTGFLMTHRPRFIESEFTVWSRQHSYAGTADFLAEIGGRNLVVDLKTGKGLYAEVGLQLAALSHADFLIREDGSEEEIPRIDGVAALHVRPRSWKLVPIEHDEDNFACFLAARKIADWNTRVAPSVLGRAA